MDIQIVSHEEADRIVSDPPIDLRGVVSIFSPPDSRMAAFLNRHGEVQTRKCLGFDEFKGHKIALSFDDSEVVAGPGVFAPQEEDVIRFLRWADTVPSPSNGKVLFHCHAGISRSAAAALVFLSLKNGAGSEAYCIGHVHKVRPQCWFNGDIVAIADKLLGRGGALVNAVMAWKVAQRQRKDIVTG